MSDDDDLHAALAHLAETLPVAAAEPATLSLPSLLGPLRTLLARSTTPQRIAQLSTAVVTLHQSPTPVSFLLSLFDASLVLLAPHCSAPPPPPPPPSPSSLAACELLWRLLRNCCTTASNQEAVITCSTLPRFLATLASLPPSPPFSRLLATGGQLLSNALTLHPANQGLFFPLLSSPSFHSLVSTPLLSLRAPILQCLRLCLLNPAHQRALLLAYPLGPALLSAAFHPSDDGDGSADCDLLAHALFSHLFTSQPSFLPLLLPSLPHSTATLPFLLDGLAQGAGEVAGGAVDATAVAFNCAALLDLLTTHYSIPLPPSDDAAGYLALPSDICLTGWAHAALRAVDRWAAEDAGEAEEAKAAEESKSAGAAVRAALTEPARRALLLALLRSPGEEDGCHVTLLRLLLGLVGMEEQEGVAGAWPVLHALSFLAHTRIDERQPLQREYAVVGLRFVCRLERVREALAGLQGMGVEGGEEWKARGVDVQWDEERERVTIGSGGRRAGTEHRTSGPIDWGETEPFTDDDFM